MEARSNRFVFNFRAGTRDSEKISGGLSLHGGAAGDELATGVAWRKHSPSCGSVTREPQRDGLKGSRIPPANEERSASTDARPWTTPANRCHEPFAGGLGRESEMPLIPDAALRSLARPASPHWYEKPAAHPGLGGEYAAGERARFVTRGAFGKETPAVHRGCATRHTTGWRARPYSGAFGNGLSIHATDHIDRRERIGKALVSGVNAPGQQHEAAWEAHHIDQIAGIALARDYIARTQVGGGDGGHDAMTMAKKTATARFTIAAASDQSDA
jgi:hypothetical protein